MTLLQRRNTQNLCLEASTYKYNPLSLWRDKQFSVLLTNWLCCLKSGEEFLTRSQNCCHNSPSLGRHRLFSQSLAVLALCFQKSFVVTWALN
jgi:hypothetical protein